MILFTNISKTVSLEKHRKVVKRQRTAWNCHQSQGRFRGSWGYVCSDSG